jgi:hypothetical protein
MKRLSLSISCFALALSFHAAIIHAQSPSDETNSDNSKGAITGRVVDQNGQPLANALVTVRSYGVNAPGGPRPPIVKGIFR